MSPAPASPRPARLREVADNPSHLLDTPPRPPGMMGRENKSIPAPSPGTATNRPTNASPRDQSTHDLHFHRARISPAGAGGHAQRLAAVRPPRGAARPLRARRPTSSELLANKPKPVILSCRRSQDGGQWKGSETNASRCCASASSSKADYVEIELDVADEIRRLPPAKRVITYTNLRETPADIDEIYAEAQRKGAGRHQAGDAGAHAGRGLAAGADPGQARHAHGRGRPGQAGRDARRAGARRSAPLGLRRPGARHGSVSRPGHRPRSQRGLRLPDHGEIDAAGRR